MTASDGATATRRRLSVVYLGHVARLSGGELALLRLLPHLPDVDAHVILGEDGPLAARLRAIPVHVEILPLPVRTITLERSRALLPGWRSLLDVARYVLSLRARLRALRPDLLHTNSLKADVIGAVAGRLARVPQVWHARDVTDPPYMGRTTAALVRTVARLGSSAVIANSSSTAWSITRGRPAAVIPSPLGEEAGRGQLDGPATAAGASRFAMVGRLAAWKGQHVVISAFARSFAQGQQTLDLYGTAMFGSDDEQYEASLHQQVEDLGLDSRVRFHGFVDDVPGALARADVLVHHSVMPEPFGQVVVEGMAAGLAVVASDDGGPAEILEHGETGLLVSPGSVDQLAETLQRLDADPGLRDRLGSAARKASTSYRATTVAGEVRAVYDRTLAARR